jgi:F-type H+-transporting ATPase subunit a
MEEVHVTLAAEKLFSLGPLPITNSLLTTWIVTILLIAFAFFATRKVTPVPQGLQNIAEIIIEPLQDLVSTLAHEKTKVFLPILASFFFFILFGNYFGLLPGVGSIGFYEEHKTEPAISESAPASQQVPAKEEAHEENTPVSQKEVVQASIPHEPETKKVFVPYLRSINSDLNTTAALAIVSVILTHILAVRYLGLGGYLGKFLSLNPIFLFVGILELFGEFTKIASLSFRLFGNIYAGEVLLTTASTQLFAYIVPIPFYFLELLVGFVQALIFTMLTLVFMVILTSKAHH